MGRHYDETGNFTDWWNNSTVEAFEDKAQCFIDQYHKFTVPNPNGEPLHVNGRLTLGENLADAGGVNAAFAAWKEAERIERGQLLPGLQTFSKDQVFFISYANWWCGKVRPEAAVNSVYRDPHAPTRARILGTMANSPDFRESFSVSNFCSPLVPTPYPILHLEKESTDWRICSVQSRSRLASCGEKSRGCWPEVMYKFLQNC